MGTILQSGNFISDGLVEIIKLRSDLDWMYVYNWTAVANSTTNGTNLNVEFYWQRGMPQSQGLSKRSYGAVPIVGGQPGPLGALQLPVGAGFTLVNQGFEADFAQVSGAVAFTGISSSTTPVVTTSSIAASGISLQDGDVVRLSQAFGSVDASDLLGIDFQIDYTNDTHFTFANVLQQATGAASVLGGNWRKVNVSSVFYPQTRYIINIATAGAFGLLNATPMNPVVVTSVDSGYLAGQEVRFHIDTVNNLNKMVEIDSLIGTIIAVDPAFPSAFQIDIDATGFTPFLFPTIAQANAIAAKYTPAYVGPVGANTAFSVSNNLDSLTDATTNILYQGIQLLGGNLAAAGNAGPAGAVGDAMYWVAGKSSLVNGN